MGGSVSQVFQSGSALLTNGHGHKVTDSTRQKVQTVFDALRANPKIGVQRLEGLLQQIPKNENILTIHDEAGYNLLQKCVGVNNVELVRWLLCRHSSTDVNRFPCSLPLHIACMKGHDDCVELLLKHGARIDVEARMCWPGPHSNNCEERGKYSIQQDENMLERQIATKLQSAIYYALDGDQVNVLTMLTQRCEEPWASLTNSSMKPKFLSKVTNPRCLQMPFRAKKPLLYLACERAAWRCVQLLVTIRQDEINTMRDEYYPIHQAVLHHSKFLELLISAGAETTVRTCTQQMTLLHVVLLVARKSAEDTLSTIRLLLEHGCKDLINAADSLGNTPLHALVVRYALEEATYGYDKWNKWDVLHLVRYLLQSGAAASINHAGNSALACVLRHVRDWEICYELLNMLLTHGGEPNMVGRDGSVPIMVCLVPLINKDPLHHFTHSMKVCYLNCIRILLKHGANPNCSYRSNLTPLHVLVFTVSENITLTCDTQKKLNFEFIKNLLILLLTHGLDPNVTISNRTQHILQSCMDMIQNVRECKDINYIYDLTLTLIQYGANPNISLNISESIQTQNVNQQFGTMFMKKTKNYIMYYYIMLLLRKELLLMDPTITFAKIIMLFYYVMEHEPLFNCLKMLYTQQLSQVPAKTTESLNSIVRELYKKPRSLKQMCRVRIYHCLNRKPGLSINKLNLPTPLKDYVLNFDP